MSWFKKKEVKTPEQILAGIKALMPMHHDYVLSDGTHTRVVPPINYPECMVEKLKAMFPESWEGLRVLDIGCNTGWLTRWVARKGAKAHGIDVEPHYLKQAEAISEGQPTSATFGFQDFLTMAPDDYDVVLFLGVLYHMPDHTKAFPAIRSVMAKDGWGIVETACAPQTRIYSGKPGDTYLNDVSCRFIPNRKDLRGLVEHYGFGVESEMEWIPGRLAMKFRIRG